MKRITQITVYPDSEHASSDHATIITLVDGVGADYVAVNQRDQEICIDPSEWPEIRSAINQLLGITK